MKKLAFLLLILAFLLFFKDFSKTKKENFVNLKGNENASVEIVLYADFQCLRTRNFWKEILPKLEEEYISRGKAKFIFKHHPKLFFNHSLEAAIASECAANQGKFWEYVDLIFRSTEAGLECTGSGLGLSPNELKEYAKKVGLNVENFEFCLDNKMTLPRIQAQINELHEKGFRASGIVFINGEIISGYRPYTEFKDKIEKFLGNT